MCITLLIVQNSVDSVFVYKSLLSLNMMNALKSLCPCVSKKESACDPTAVSENESEDCEVSCTVQTKLVWTALTLGGGGETNGDSACCQLAILPQLSSFKTARKESQLLTFNYEEHP